MSPLFLMLLCLPILEIAVLVQVGGMIGLGSTILLVLITAVAGTFLLRQQGLSLLFSAQQQVAQGRLPAETMVEGVAVAVGGALLLTPGFLTDTIGFACLIPWSRRILVTQIKRRLSGNGVSFGVAHSASDRSSDDSGATLEGEFKRDE